jgi:TRAP-type C4-dicarboxylate transport system permease small subunit
VKNFKYFWQRAEKVDALVNRVFVYIAGFFVFCPMFAITADVFCRYIFNNPIPGTTEIVTMMIVFMIFLSLAYSLSQRGFVRVEILTQFFPSKFGIIVELFTLLLFFIIFGLLFWQATKSAAVSTLKREYVWGLINVPQYPAKWAVSVGVLLVLVRIVFQIGDLLITLSLAIRKRP